LDLFAGLQPGIIFVTTASAVAAAVSAAFSSSDFSHWRFDHFAGWHKNSGLAADSAIPNGDGVPNLLQFALNLDPDRSDATPMTPNGIKGLPLLGRDSSHHLTLTFVRRKASTNPGITYTVLFSHSLTTAFAPNFASTTSLPVSIDSTWERVVVTDSVAHLSRLRQATNQRPLIVRTRLIRCVRNEGFCRMDFRPGTLYFRDRI
jgi:hypothetical protein